MGPVKNIVKYLSIFAIACGIGIWGVILFAPKPIIAPPLLTLNASTNHDTTALANWFGGNQPKLQLKLNGLIISDQQSIALISIRGAAPQAYRIGQTLAPGNRLVSIDKSGITIDHNGQKEHIKAPRREPLPANGFVVLDQPNSN